MFSQAAQNVIFSEVLPDSDSQTALVENRSCTPDSGGGYFTLSESDTGSALGKESPNQDTNRRTQKNVTLFMMIIRIGR